MGNIKKNDIWKILVFALWLCALRSTMRPFNPSPQETVRNACVVKLVPPLVSFQPKLISFTFPHRLVGQNFICCVTEGLSSLCFSLPPWHSISSVSITFSLRLSSGSLNVLRLGYHSKHLLINLIRTTYQSFYVFHQDKTKMHQWFSFNSKNLDQPYPTWQPLDTNGS